MFFGVLQRLRIVEKTKGRLILREYPLMEWLMVLALLVGSFNMVIFDLHLTAIGAMIIAGMIAFVARIRVIEFLQASDVLRIAYRYPLHRQVINEMPIDDIKRAYLLKDESANTQVILVTIYGEMGLTVYSQDMRDWKEEIVFVINEFLHTARLEKAKQDAESLEKVEI